MRGLRPALSTFIFLLLITGGVYPLLTTVLGQWWFPWQANGSLIRVGDTVRGSALIGQNFTGNGYFQGNRLPLLPCCAVTYGFTVWVGCWCRLLVSKSLIYC